MKEFESEDWPPKTGAAAAGSTSSPSKRSSVTSESIPEESGDSTADHPPTEQGQSEVDDRNTAAADDTPDPKEEAPRTDQTQTPSTPPRVPETSPAAAPATSPAPSTLGDDDPQTREPVHPAVELTLEAFIAVLSHPAKVPKACEYAMEGIHLLVAHRYVSGRAGGLDDVSGSGARWVSAAATATEPGQRPPPASLLHRVLESVAKCCESSVETTQMAVIRTMKTILTSPKCGVHESSMLLAFRSTFHVYLVTKSTALKNSAKAALLDMLRSVMSRMEAYEVVLNRRQTLDAPASSEVDAPTSDVATTPSSPSMVEREQEANFATTFASQYHADSYALFRSLCKMSSKEVDAENENETAVGTFFNIQAQSDPMSLNGKILALELILSAMDYSGKAFGEGERFIFLVQHYLCVSLLKNCVSNHTQVAFLSQKIFMVLLYKFKDNLKQEIEVFMSNVFLRVLESPNSSFKQKALVLESLRSLCQDPVLLTQLFLNYDCDFEARNLYKEIVHILTKLGGKATSNPANTAKKELEQEFELSLAGLEVLTKIMRAFLKALGLPCEQDDESADTAGARIRGMLQLDGGFSLKQDGLSSSGADTVVSDDSSLVSTSRHGSSADAAEGATNATSNAEVAGKIVDAFEQKRNAEQNFEIGVVKFTLSLKNGLNFFISNGFVELDAREIALFFLAHKDKLDKTQMGEALGREPDAAFVKGEGVEPDKGGPGFWFRILHHYVEALDFTNISFDEAIRLFLSGFRLPGEAQKIDRIMEKFAERFTWQNPDVFPSADTAFILAFSVIMLNTDLHNPSIKPERRMTMESFIRNNRGIGANGGDLPDNFLIAIFNNIKERPFSLKEDDAARERVGAQKPLFEASALFENSSLFGDNAEERRRERFKKERDEMMAVTQQLVRRRTDKKTKTPTPSALADNVAPADVVKPMFDVTWGPMLGILSQVLECSDDERSVAACLTGFVYAVRISAHSRMTLARDTFVSSLAKFTYLGSIKEMKEKNLACIRTLLSISLVDGEYLGESWGPVLQCISQIARLRLTASGLDTDDSFLLVEKEKPKKSLAPARVDLFRVQPTKSELAKEAEESNAQAVLEAVQEVLMDKVFSSTVQLSAGSLAHFIEQLIIVSSSEIKGNSKSGITGVDSSGLKDSDDIGSTTHSISGSGDGPSIFSLQRLVEVADYNMDVRPRLVWAQIWGKMSEYFAKIACDRNSRVTFFAIDSLKQLSSKFLEKPELSEFNFQRTFLTPFLVVMDDKGSDVEIREMVLQCIDHIVQTKSQNLRSGWITIFQILRRSAIDSDEKVENLGLSILQRLLDEHLSELCNLTESGDEPEGSEELTTIEKRHRNANVDDFIGLCRASLSFVRQVESDSPRPIGLSMRAFSHIAIYADLLADGRVLPPVSGAQVRSLCDHVAVRKSPNADCSLCFLQFTDSAASGYTYEGLNDAESLEMALWRPLLEGLAEGVRSSAKSSAGGVGCLLQRSSILAFRAILIRHGHIFSTDQWAAILDQTLIPAIQAGAEQDQSPVLRITSESPSVSNIDFLVDSLLLPPPSDDSALLAFKKLQPSSKRFMGEAELMLEASFCDLRHGGNGDPSKAYSLAKKDAGSEAESDQPFPDSWIATTAPIALGLLTDIANTIVLDRGAAGRERLWPLIAAQYRRWSVGLTKVSSPTCWRPCEALIRIACREARRFPVRLSQMMDRLTAEEAESWASDFLLFLATLLSESVQRETSTHRELLRAKKQALIDRRGIATDGESLDDDESDKVVTPFGNGIVQEKRKPRTAASSNSGEYRITTSVIKLECGATLYQPVAHPSSPRLSDGGCIPKEVTGRCGWFHRRRCCPTLTPFVSSTRGLLGAKHPRIETTLRCGPLPAPGAVRRHLGVVFAVCFGTRCYAAVKGPASVGCLGGGRGQRRGSGHGLSRGPVLRLGRRRRCRGGGPRERRTLVPPARERRFLPYPTSRGEQRRDSALVRPVSRHGAPSQHGQLGSRPLRGSATIGGGEGRSAQIPGIRPAGRTPHRPARVAERR